MSVMLNESCSDDAECYALSPAIGNNVGSVKSFDPVTFSFLKVSAEKYAEQLTLLDLPVFKAIETEELSSCSWTGREKLIKAENVVKFTHRFNQVCLWCEKEILSCESVSRRADIVGHFVKIAKKLFEINSLNACFAILSGLQSAPIHRLNRTWTQLATKEKGWFEKLTKLFSTQENSKSLRKHMLNIRLPCIPFLGLYLADLTYIDVAHPKSMQLGKSARENQMNNILRVISDYQSSSFPALKEETHIKEYLLSHRYIEELQKFVEDENYKKSIVLEPEIPTVNEPTSARGGQSNGQQWLLDSRGSVDKAELAPTGRYVRGHRKAVSLGTPGAFFADKPHVTEVKNETLPSHSNLVCLLDDSMLDKTGGEDEFGFSDLKSTYKPPKSRTLPRKSYRKSMCSCANCPQCKKASSLESRTSEKFGHVSIADAYNSTLATSPMTDSKSDLYCLTPTSSATTPSAVDHLPPCPPPSKLSLTSSSMRKVGRGLRQPMISPDRDVGYLGPAVLSGEESVKFDEFTADLKVPIPLFDQESHCVHCRFTVVKKLSICSGLLEQECVFQGAVRRRTVLKHGRKPTVSTWSRYWLCLSNKSLIYYPARSLSATRNPTDRKAYKDQPAKMMFLSSNFFTFLEDNDHNPDMFRLTELNSESQYKFKTGSQSAAMSWVKHIKETIRAASGDALPSDLIAL